MMRSILALAFTAALGNSAIAADMPVESAAACSGSGLHLDRLLYRRQHRLGSSVSTLRGSIRGG